MESSESSNDVVLREGLTYCEHDGAALQGDLYLPKGKGPFPILIGLPGGGWRICIRASLREWSFYLASQGYGVFVIDYRLATATRKAFPEAVKDVLAAIRFIRSAASELSIDQDRIGLLGGSAGAHLAALTALGGDAAVFASDSDDATIATSAHVKALVAVCGVYDLRAHWQDDLVRNAEPRFSNARNLIGQDPYENPQAYFEASPLRHITYAKNQISTLVSWSASDEMVDPAQAEAFVRALQQARFNVRTHKLLDASHFWFGESPCETSSASAVFAPRLLQFLKWAL
jgi:acetyl esterase/lipase